MGVHVGARVASISSNLEFINNVALTSFEGIVDCVSIRLSEVIDCSGLHNVEFSVVIGVLHGHREVYGHKAYLTV